MLTVLLGGARSGKSALALDLALAWNGAIAFIATCPHIDGDVELAARITDHRAERPDGWTTIEEEHDLAGALGAAGGAFAVVDCLTLWVANLQHRGATAADVERAAEAAIDAARDRAAPTVVVSNEVGLGIVPADALSREFRDVLGRVNQRWIAAADRALLLVAGKALPLHDPRELLP